jgi:RNA polymerase sigma-B factor
MLEALRTTDEALEEVERREALRPLLDQLPERERRIVVLRFFRGMTQSEIAAEIGISQMHVSRLLTSTLTRLRARLAD